MLLKNKTCKIPISILAGFCFFISSAKAFTISAPALNNNTYCSGSRPFSIVSSVAFIGSCGCMNCFGFGGATLQNSFDSTGGWTNVVSISCCCGGGLTFSSINNIAPASTRFYRAIKYLSFGGADTSDILKITVIPGVSNNLITPGQTICSGSAPATIQGTLPSGQDTLFNYLWIDSAFSTFSPSSGANNLRDYTPPALTSTKWYKRIAINNTNGCRDSSATLKIVVHQPVSNNTLSGAQNNCYGLRPATIQGSVPSGGTGVYIYKWEKSTVNGNSGFVDAAGINNNRDYAFSSDTLQLTTWFRRIVSSGACTPDTSLATKITVHPYVQPMIALTPNGSINLCTGDSIVLHASSDTGVTFQWSSYGFDISNAVYSDYIAKTPGNYRVTVRNSSGCTNNSSSALVAINTKPIVKDSVSGPTTFCAGKSVAIITKADTSYRYQWKNNGINMNGATSASYSAQSNGNYKVIVTTSSGCSDSSSGVNVVVNALPIATATPDGPTTFCEGGSVTIHAFVDTGYAYQWKNGTNIIGGASGATIMANISGNYKVVVTNGKGCKDSSASINIKVNSLPAAEASAGGDTIFCFGKSVILHANTDSGYGYHWRNGSMNIPGAANSTYMATTSGTYKAFVTDTNGCMDSSAGIHVMVNPLPVISAFAGGATTFCQGRNVIIHASGESGIMYQWKKNSSAISGATDSIHFVNSSGNYHVAATNVNGCIDSSTKITVTVNPLPVAVVTPPGTTTICQGSYVSLTANTGTGLSYQWMKDGVPVPNSTNRIFQANTAGNYKVIVTNNYGCMDTSNVVTVNVNPKPVPGVITGDSVVTRLISKIYSVNSHAGSSYQWVFSNGSGSSTSNSINITWVSSGVDKLKVVETASTGCNSDSVSQNIYILPAIGIKDFAKVDHLISIYPNPTPGILYIEHAFTGALELQIQSVDGKVTKDFYLQKGMPSVNLENLDAGMYFLSFLQEGELIGRFRVVIVR